MNGNLYSIGTWDTESQSYTPQQGMRNPCINVPWTGLLAALRELRREHGYDLDGSVLVERTTTGKTTTEK